MTQVGDDAQHCLERLEHHESRLDKLYQLLRRSGSVVGRDDDLTRELYRSIKTDLKEEAHQSDTAGETALTDAERIWCQTAVVQAYAELPAPTTARLDRKLRPGSLGRVPRLGRRDWVSPRAFVSCESRDLHKIVPRRPFDILAFCTHAHSFTVLHDNRDV